MNDTPKRSYDDILNYEYVAPQRHARMSRAARAAQFAPFAALSGFGDSITEAGRYTEEEIKLSEEERSRMGERLSLLQSRIGEKPEVFVRFFEPDGRKPGGAYAELTGRLIRIDAEAEGLVFENGTEIRFDRIIFIDALGFTLDGSDA